MSSQGTQAAPRPQTKRTQSSPIPSSSHQLANVVPHKCETKYSLLRHHCQLVICAHSDRQQMKLTNQDDFRQRAFDEYWDRVYECWEAEEAEAEAAARKRKHERQQPPEHGHQADLPPLESSNDQQRSLRHSNKCGGPALVWTPDEARLRLCHDRWAHLLPKPIGLASTTQLNQIVPGPPREGKPPGGGGPDERFRGRGRVIGDAVHGPGEENERKKKERVAGRGAVWGSNLGRGDRWELTRMSADKVGSVLGVGVGLLDGLRRVPELGWVWNWR